MGVPGVDGGKTQTNHVMETWAVLGIEAARAKIIQQIDETMASHGMAIDARHTMLLADCMSYKARHLPRRPFHNARFLGPVTGRCPLRAVTDGPCLTPSEPLLASRLLFTDCVRSHTSRRMSRSGCFRVGKQASQTLFGLARGQGWGCRGRCWACSGSAWPR